MCSSLGETRGGGGMPAGLKHQVVHARGVGRAWQRGDLGGGLIGRAIDQ